ncbi:BON domain-containing protein [Methylicorpusculum sp.]|uniref:BON domain-containing protein n=1 Tax=Methylicorpusculum sp. TaxID=2713644 RepID=UPI00351E7E3E
MNMSKIASGFLIGLLLATSVAGCTSTPTRSSTGEYIDDSVVTSSIKALIYDDPELKIGQISVKTYKGVVQLSGFVNSKQAADKAAALARSVKGVDRVDNSLIVK